MGIYRRETYNRFCARRRLRATAARFTTGLSRQPIDSRVETVDEDRPTLGPEGYRQRPRRELRHPTAPSQPHDGRGHHMRRHSLGRECPLGWGEKGAAASGAAPDRAAPKAASHGRPPVRAAAVLNGEARRARSPDGGKRSGALAAVVGEPSRREAPRGRRRPRASARGRARRRRGAHDLTVAAREQPKGRPRLVAAWRGRQPGAHA